MTDTAPTGPEMAAKESADALKAAQTKAAADAKAKADADAKALADAQVKAAAEAETKAKADEAAAVAKIEPDKPATHPPVMPIAGHKCTVEGCPFIFGDPKFGVEPHPVGAMQARKVANVEPPRPEPPAPKPSAEGICQPIGAMNECPICHWSAATSVEPHPVLA